MTGVDFRGFEASDQTVIWRYMTTDRFRHLLSGRLYFPAAHQFEDKFEGAITEAAARWREAQARRFHVDDDFARGESLVSLSSAFEDLRRMTKVSCWHACATENAAMWGRYLPTPADGVAVRSTVGALKGSLRPFRLNPTYGEEKIAVGRVLYIDYAVHEMAGSSMLGVFMYKRHEHGDEQEVRALLSLRVAVEFGVAIPDDGVEVEIDLDELIHEVRTSPAMGDSAVAVLNDATRRAGVRAQVGPSTLSARPTY